MRRILLLLCLGLMLPAAAPGSTLRDLIKADEPSSILLVPFFEVDTTDPNGTTTLFAIRNVTTSDLNVTIAYLDLSSALRHDESIVLAARQTRTVNIRDVVSAEGLPADPDGFARGSIIVVAATVATNPVMVGDFFQVDVAGNFATGERMVSGFDLCLLAETRFLDFGSGTDLRILINSPQGDDAMVDPPSFSVSAIDENGVQSASVPFHTDQASIKLSAADFTALTFGTLVFDFSNSDGGVIFSEYSAEGRFSVGLTSACLVRAPIAPQAQK